MRRMEPAVKLGDSAPARRVAGVEIVAIVGTGLLFGVPIALFIMNLLIDAVVGAFLLAAVGGGAWWWHHWRTYQAMKVAQMLSQRQPYTPVGPPTQQPQLPSQQSLHLQIPSHWSPEDARRFMRGH